MSDEEGYRSSEDEDYVPTDGEEVSEEENSGEEENLGILNLDAVKKDGDKRKRKKPKGVQARKRKGGIKLEGETVSEPQEEDTGNKQLEEEIAKEVEQKKEELQKKKADDLWSSFMSDVGKVTPKRTTSSSLGSLASLNKPVVSAAKPEESKKEANKVTVTKVYDFAGEQVKVTKEVDAKSKEGKAELKKLEDDNQTDKTTEESPQIKTMKVQTNQFQEEAKIRAVLDYFMGLTQRKNKRGKRPSAGLGGILDKINKKPKMGTLEKSKLDWDTFKKKEGIEEELALHNRGKQSFIERQNFLQRTDLRQFEIEKSLRLSSSSKR